MYKFNNNTVVLMYDNRSFLPMNQLVKNYLLLTHASTHNQYSMELLDVYRCDKEGESDRYTDYGNR